MSEAYNKKLFIESTNSISNMWLVGHFYWNNTYHGAHVEDGNLLLNPFYVPSPIVVTDDIKVLGISTELGELAVDLFESKSPKVLPILANRFTSGIYAREIRDNFLACLSQNILKEMLEKTFMQAIRDREPTSRAYYIYYSRLCESNDSLIHTLPHPKSGRIKEITNNFGKAFKSLPKYRHDESLDKLGNFISELRKFIN